MNIHENTALLDAFVDGELTSEEMISVQSHLDECPECRAYVDDVLVIRASFPTEDNAELPADFAETVMKAVAETPPPSGRLYRKRDALRGKSAPVPAQKAALGQAGGSRCLSGGHCAGAARHIGRCQRQQQYLRCL